MPDSQLIKDLTIQLLNALKRCEKLEAKVQDLEIFEADICRGYEANLAGMQQTIKSHERTIAQLNAQLPEV